MLKVNFGKVLEADPFKLERKNSRQSSQLFYKICIAIPMMITLALLFFLIFFLSPRGQSVRLYQKRIFSWNQDRMAAHMETLSFKYKVMPYQDIAFSHAGTTFMKHEDTELNAVKDKRYVFSGSPTELEKIFEKDPEGEIKSNLAEEQLEETLRSIYYYQQSFFNEPHIPYGVFPDYIFDKKEASEQPLQHFSEDFCVYIEWRNLHPQVTGNTSAGLFKYSGLSGLPLCRNSPAETALKWQQSDPQTGLSFKIYKFTQLKDLSCAVSKKTCELDCKLEGGLYVPDEGPNGACYELKIVHKLCVKVGLTFEDFLDAREGEIVTDVKDAQGCYAKGNPALYKKVPIDKVTAKTFTFDQIPLEVRSQEDPYAVFSGIDKDDGGDLSWLFWLSVISLVTAGLLMITMAVYYSCYIAK